MKVAIAQIKPVKGNITTNIDLHKRFIQQAIVHHADAIFFPELSITGYEPELAKDLATTQHDSRFDTFQKMSDKSSIMIAVGIPTKADIGIRISMIIFQPDQPRQTYSKQLLHTDELPYFIHGEQQLMLTISDIKIAPAICYESLQPSHAENAGKLGAGMYVASIAKSQNGINKAMVHYPAIAKQLSIPVLMVNSVGYCDNFLSVGQSSIWTSRGILAKQLDDKCEGLLVFNTETEEVIEQIVC